MNDKDLVALFERGYNEADDGETRVSTLELAGLRAVYEAGRTDGSE